jgi:hypothetical protein
MPHFPMDTGFKSSSPETSRDNTHQLSIHTKNRRKRYLDLHPEYFSAELELAGPRALSLFLTHNTATTRHNNHNYRLSRC